MAKGVTLASTRLYRVIINEDGSINAYFQVKDDAGNVVSDEEETRLFADWPNQVRANANNLMRLLDTELSKAKANENKSDWVDK